MKPIEYLYSGMLLSALILVYFAYKQYINTTELRQSGVKTTAKVIDLIEVSGDDGYTYKPVFQYTDRSQNVITFNSEISSKPASYKIGDKVKIIYSKNGDDRKVVSFWGLYRWVVILLSIASPLLIIGGGYIWYTLG